MIQRHLISATICVLLAYAPAVAQQVQEAPPRPPATVGMVDRQNPPDLIETSMPYTGKGGGNAATVVPGRLARHQTTPKGTYYQSDEQLAVHNFLGNASFSGGIFLPADASKPPQVYYDTLGGPYLLTSPPITVSQAQPIVPSQAAYNHCIELAARKVRPWSACLDLEPVRPNQQMPTGPVRPDFEQAARDYITSRLRDPDSGRIRMVRPPIKERIPRMLPLPDGAEQAERPEYGWVACFGVNARNGYGGYTGEEAWVVILDDGRFRSFGEGDSVGAGRAGQVINDSISTECSRQSPN